MPIQISSVGNTTISSGTADVIIYIPKYNTLVNGLVFSYNHIFEAQRSKEAHFNVCFEPFKYPY